MKEYKIRKVELIVYGYGRKQIYELDNMTADICNRGYPDRHLRYPKNVQKLDLKADIIKMSYVSRKKRGNQNDR